MLKNSLKTRSQTQTAVQRAIKILIVQLVTVCIIALVLSIKDLILGYSALLGGLIYIIPNAYYTYKVLIKNNKMNLNKSANHTLADLYSGQIWKMVIGAMLFALTFVLVKPLSPFSLFGTFIAIQPLGWYLQMGTKNKFIKL